MAKKQKKPIGRFGALTLRGQQFTVQKFDAMLKRATPHIGIALERLREGNNPLATSIFILADITHEGSRLLVRDLAGEGAFPNDGLVGVARAEQVAAVLRKYEADEQVVQLTRPLAPGHIRVLFTQQGEVTIIDEPIP